MEKEMSDLNYVFVNENYAYHLRRSVERFDNRLMF